MMTEIKDCRHICSRCHREWSHTDFTGGICGLNKCFECFSTVMGLSHRQYKLSDERYTDDFLEWAKEVRKCVNKQ